MDTNGIVIAVARSSSHTFSKQLVPQIRLLAGVGVEGDAHAGSTVKHRSRVARDESKPNLRQVHLIHAELHDMLNDRGFDVTPGAIGENITTRGIDLLALPTGTRMRIGPDAVIRVTGLRNPCKQLDAFQSGLQRAVLDRTPDGDVASLAGVMAVVEADGNVAPDDAITIELPDGDPVPLAPV